MRTILLTCLTALGLLLSTSVMAQTRTVTGTVTDADTRETLPGVNVVVKGTTIGVMTDMEGVYSIKVSEGQVLQFSSIGYIAQEITVGSSDRIDAALKTDVQVLNEVVIVGYGSQKKASLTGAVSTVDVEQALQSRPITDVGRALQGSTPGLTVTTTSGAIGDAPSIKIRSSYSSIQGKGNPLVLVDNVEVPDLSYVNPDDIENISILKDASTTAIYGTRGAFGAILITTKKGNKSGQVKVSYSNNFAWSTSTKIPEHTRADLNLRYSFDQLNALEPTPKPGFSIYVGGYLDLASIDKVKEWIDKYGSGKDLGREMVEGRDFSYKPGGKTYFYRPWDLKDIYYKDWTPQQTQNLSIQGGSEKTQFTLSAGYLNQKGILKMFDDYYKRLNVSGSISTELRKWVSIRAKYLYAKTEEQSPFSYTGTTYDPMYYVYRWHQTHPYGTYNGNEFRGAVNEMKDARPVEDDSYYSRYTLGATFNIMKGWTADLDYTYSQNFEDNHTVGGYANGIDFWNRASDDTFDGLVKNYSSAAYDYASRFDKKTIRNSYNAYTTYENKIGDHNFKMMLGTNIEDEEYLYTLMKREGIYDFEKGEINLGKGTLSSAGSHTWWSLAGFFGRLNYNYKERYLIEFDARYDGSSKYGKGHRWLFCPSVSGAWRVSEENFMQPYKHIINSLKIRGSYGEIGSQDIDANLWFPTLPVQNPISVGNYWLIDNNWAPFIYATNSTGSTLVPTLTDPRLTWETIATADLGLDARFLNDKLGFTIDLYQRKTMNLVVPGAALPASVGAAAANTNNGEMTTNGIEISVDYNHTFANGLYVSASAQYTDYVSKLTKYPSVADPLNSATYYQGKTMGEIWGYESDGLFQNEDFLWENGAIKTDKINTRTENLMAEGVPNQYILEKDNFVFSPGDVKFKDLDGSGVIDFGSNTVNKSGDRKVIGNTLPRYQFGLNLTASWKGFDMSMFIQGVGRRNIWATGNMVLPGYTAAEANFAHTLDYWTPTNTDAFYPRPMSYAETAKWNYLPNDRYLLNTAYVRLKTLTIGYTLPKNILNRVNIERMRVFFTGENLFEFDKMGDVPIDPEINWTTATSNDSRSFGRSYPYRRTLSFGIQLDL